MSVRLGRAQPLAHVPTIIRRSACGFDVTVGNAGYNECRSMGRGKTLADSGGARVVHYPLPGSSAGRPLEYVDQDVDFCSGKV